MKPAFAKQLYENVYSSITHKKSQTEMTTVVHEMLNGQKKVTYSYRELIIPQ
jgi:hypothetical protein